MPFTCIIPPSFLSLPLNKSSLSLSLLSHHKCISVYLFLCSLRQAAGTMLLVSSIYTGCLVIGSPLISKVCLFHSRLMWVCACVCLFSPLLCSSLLFSSLSYCLLSCQIRCIRDCFLRCFIWLIELHSVSCYSQQRLRCFPLIHCFLVANWGFYSRVEMRRERKDACMWVHLMLRSSLLITQTHTFTGKHLSPFLLSISPVSRVSLDS